jgi:integrase
MPGIRVNQFDWRLKMARDMLTDKEIKNAKSRKKAFLLCDGDRLYLRVRPDRAKQWVFIYRLDGVRRMSGLGVYPAVGLSAARELAAACRENVAKGIDPIEAKRRASVERRSEQLRQASRYTLRGLFDEWQRRELSRRRKDGGKSTRRIFEKDVFPAYGDRYAADLTRQNIQSILDNAADRGVKKLVNIIRGELRQMFSYALNREIVPADPTATIRKLEGAEPIRTRVLSPDEIRELAEKLPGSGLLPKYQAAASIMLATCARVGELSRARWDDLDMVAGTWTIPAENAKNGREHVIHLSDFARRHFASLPRYANSEFIFPGRELSAPIDRQTITKEICDRQRVKRFKGRTVKAGTLRLSGGPWTSHDLRRTGSTLMGELNIPPHVIDRCLNHVEASKVTRTYQLQELLPERRAAFERLGERLEAILAAEPGKVAMFKSRKRS